MVFLLIGIVALAVVALLWRRVRQTGADDVIYLGYDDQDNVYSMRGAMLDKLRRGDLHHPE